MQTSVKLPASAKIRRSHEFSSIKEGGARVQSYNFTVQYRKRQKGGPTRLGITVSTKIDKRAVIRNRIKRLIREMFRAVRSLIEGSFDIVVIARKNSSELKFEDVFKELTKAFSSAGIIEKKQLK